MAARIPPPPLSREEFKKRFEAGARTMKKMDPDLYEWLEAEKKQQMIVLYLSIGRFLFFICMVVYAILTQG